MQGLNTQSHMWDSHNFTVGYVIIDKKINKIDKSLFIHEIRFKHLILYVPFLNFNHQAISLLIKKITKWTNYYL